MNAAVERASHEPPRTDGRIAAAGRPAPGRPAAARQGVRDGIRLAEVERVCVFRALQLGDMLCTLPALRSLRAGLPRASIALVGLPWARAFVRRFRRYVDEFIEFPGHPQMPEQPARPELWADFVARMRARRFDLALQLHGSGDISNELVAAFGARRCAGFHPAAGSAPDAATFLAWEAREPEVLRYLRLVRHLGLPDCGTGLEWPVLDAEEERPPAALGSDYVCVHPGARLLSRRWPVQRFAQVADRLAASGHAIVITGSAEEADLASELALRMRARALDLSGKTSLGGLAGVIRRARLLVCNDTGVSHIAAAVGTPSVVVCCGADPARWAPLDAARHRVLYHDTDCRPCMHVACPVGHGCATGIAPEQVADEAIRLLRRAARSAARDEVLL